jgi:hypothetical protein
MEPIDQLIAFFNQRSLDLPDGLFDRKTQFLVNGVAFEEMLGRSPKDPLVLMLARGPAGYRFTVKAIQHAIPDASVVRGELVERDTDGARIVSGEAWLSGHLRGTGEPAEVMFKAEMHLTAAGVAERVAITIDEAQLDRLRTARARE